MMSFTVIRDLQRPPSQGLGQPGLHSLLRDAALPSGSNALKKQVKEATGFIMNNRGSEKLNGLRKTRSLVAELNLSPPSLIVGYWPMCLFH